MLTILGSLFAHPRVSSARRITSTGMNRACLSGSISILVLVLAAAAVIPARAYATVFYVDAARADDTGDGLTWATAEKTIGAGLADAIVILDEVWVKAGTYVGGTTATGVTMTTNKRLYGGFAGTEVPGVFDLATRNFVTNETIITGVGATGRTVGLTANNNDTIFDGFSVQASLTGLRGVNYTTAGTGNIIRNCVIKNNVLGAGGGMTITNNPVALSNCTFSGNISNGSGAALFLNTGGAMVVNNCTFTSNSITAATTFGGAIRAQSGASAAMDLTLNNCTFSSNTATNVTGAAGGAASFANAGNTFVVTVNDCTFNSNTSASNALTAGGGAVHVFGGVTTNFNRVKFYSNSAGAASGGGAVYFRANTGVTAAGRNVGNFTNCTFDRCTAANGGGIFVGAATTATASSYANLVNCSFFDCISSLVTGNSVQVGSAVPTTSVLNVLNCVSHSTAATTNPDFNGAALVGANIGNSSFRIAGSNFTSQGGNLTAGTDPLYTSTADPANMVLQAGSPAINVGVNTAPVWVPTTPTTIPVPTNDFVLATRPSGGTTDMGAYELLIIDVTPPNATTITPATTGPTNASSVAFTVTFDESVQNFNAAADVTVTHTGTASTGVTITGGPSTYTVTVTGISGNGSFTLTVNTGSDVQDLAGNPLASSVTSAAVTIDTAAPTVSIGSPTGSPLNSSGTATYPITVTGSSSVNLVSGNVTLNHSGTAGGSVTILNGTTATPSVQITGVTGDGSYTINIAAGIAADAATNTSLVAGPSAGSVTVDNTEPTVSIGPPTGSPVNSGGTATYPITVTGSSSVNLVSGNVTLNHAGTAGGSVTILNGTTATPSVEVSGVTGDGTYTISIAAGIASDAATNTSLVAGPSAGSVSVDNTAPTVSIGSPTGSPVNSGGTATYPITVSGSSSVNLVSGNVTLNHSGTAGGSVTILNGATASPSVQVTGVTGDGSYTISIAAGIASDAATNTSLAVGPSAGSVTVDNTAPGITLSTVSGNPVGGVFTVDVVTTEASTNFDLSDLSPVNGTVSAFTGSGTSYSFNLTPTVTPCSVSVALGKFSDAAGNGNTVSNTLSRNLDATLPSVISIVPATTGPTNATSVAFTVTFDETVTGFNNASDVIVNHGGTASTGVTVSAGTNIYTVTITGISGDGSFTIEVSTSSDVRDATLNALASSVTSAAVNIDNTAPGITLSSAAGDPVNGAIAVSVLLGESSVNFDASDITPSNATVSGFGGSGTGYTFTLTPTLDGSFDASVAAAKFTDTAGNNNTVSNTLSRTFDGTDPVFSNVVADPASASEDDLVQITFASSEAIAGDPAVTVNGNPATRTAKAAFTFEYTVLPTDPVGPATIEVSGVDDVGNAGMLTDSSALTIVSPTASVPLFAWPVGLALAALGAAALRTRKRR